MKKKKSSTFFRFYVYAVKLLFFRLAVLSWQIIHTVLHPLCPLLRRATLVEGLPWNGLSDVNGEMFSNVTVHLVNEE